VKRPWDGVVSDADLEVYRTTGFGKATGLGKRPALLVIDVQYRTAGTRPVPIRQAVEEYPTACGEYAWRAIPNIVQLIAAFRHRNLPVVYPCIAPKTVHDKAGFAAKVPGVMTINAKGYEFVAEIAPMAQDIILPKIHASAFFGTPLASYLVSLGADSVVVSGCSTSGCVRATVVDACSLNYRVAVAEDAVYDRGQVSHAVNLFDMASKYADVLPTSDLAELLSD
jgi:maleamate amidohydrolase